MKGMASTQEFQQAPLPGRYWSNIVEAAAEFAKSGASMIHLKLAINDPRFPQYKDMSAEDYMITDGSAKGGGMGKTKLRGLGIDVDSSDQEIADEAICAQLAGKGIWVDYGNEQRMTRNGEDGPYDIPMTVVDARSGQTIKLMKLTVKGYATHNVGQAQQAPQQVAPQGAPYAQAPVQAAPVQQAPQFAQQQPPPQFQQPAQAPQGGFAPSAGFAPPPAQQFQPIPQAPQGNLQPAFQQPPAQGQAPQLQQAAPPWAQQPQQGQAPVQNGAPAEPKKRKKIQDTDANGNPIPG